MKYIGTPMGMWALFAGSFQKQLTEVLGYDTDTAKAITKKAKPKYKVIIADLPEFEKADRFKMNIVNCAMIGAWDSRLRVTSRGYMLGYNDLKDPSVSGFFRLLAKVGDGVMKMQIVKIGFGGRKW